MFGKSPAGRRRAFAMKKAQQAADWVNEQATHESFWTALGFTAAVGGAVSGSIGLLLISNMLEGSLPWHERRRWLFGFVLQAGVAALTDTLAYATCPLSLISPLAGLTLALSTTWAALGCFRGIHEPIGRAEAMTIGVIWGGVTMCSITGPRSVDNGDLDELEVYLRQSGFVSFWICFSVSIAAWVAVLELPRWGAFPALKRLKPRSDRVCAFISALNAAGCAALTQVFLKIVAMVIPWSIEKRSVPLSNVWVWASLAMLGLYAITQLYLLNSTMSAASVTFAVPIFSSLLVLCTVTASALCFGDFQSMASTNFVIFFLGAGFVTVGILVLSKLQQERADSRPGTATPDQLAVECHGEAAAANQRGGKCRRDKASSGSSCSSSPNRATESTPCLCAAGFGTVTP